jgi:DNA-binding transcriptional ArsR family regulator
MNQSQGKVIEEYSKEIPREIKDVITGLAHDIRLSIVIALLKNMKMTFTELKKLLDLNSSSLSYHLSLLQDGGLVDNIIEWKDQSYSYYVITDVARSVLESLFDIIVKFPVTSKYNYTEAQLRSNPYDTSGSYFTPLKEWITEATELRKLTQLYDKALQFGANDQQTSEIFGGPVLETAANRSTRRRQNQDTTYSTY